MKKFALFILMVCLVACDARRDERNVLQSDLGKHLEALVVVDQKIETLNLAMRNIEATMSSLKTNLLSDESNENKSRDALLSYALNHKLAVAAAGASSFALLTVLSENLSDEQKALIIGVGTAGLACCMLGAEDGECADAAAKVAYYGAQIAYYKADGTKLRNQIADIQTNMAQITSQQAPLLAEHTALSTNISALKEHIDELACRFCL